MVFDMGAQAGGAVGVAGRQAGQLEARAVREGETGPDDEHPLLADGDLIVIAAEKSRASGHEDRLLMEVVDIAADLREERSGEVGVDLGFEEGRYERAGSDRGACRSRVEDRGRSAR